MEDELKAILLEDLEQKKEIESFMDTVCDVCGNEIFEGEVFFFFGASRKVCQSCKDSIADLLL